MNGTPHKTCAAARARRAKPGANAPPSRREAPGAAGRITGGGGRGGSIKPYHAPYLADPPHHIRGSASLCHTRRMPKRATKYWLIKSEPGTYSIDDLERDRTEPWDGVRNYQARNFMRNMAKGDLAIFYHSSATPPGAVGISHICREAYPDPTQFDKKSKYYDAKSKKEDPRWSHVDVEFIEKFNETIPLQALKDDAALEGMVVTQKGSRLSVQPVEKKHFKRVLKIAGARTKVS